jgi:hypothetical protein
MRQSIYVSYGIDGLCMIMSKFYWRKILMILSEGYQLYFHPIMKNFLERKLLTKKHYVFERLIVR